MPPPSCYIWSCTTPRQSGNGRRASGLRRRHNSPSCSKSASCAHDGYLLHTEILTVPDVLGKRRNDRRRVLARKLDQHRKAAVTLNQCGDVRIIPSAKKIAFPMAGHGTILGLGGPLADRDHIEDVSLPTPGIVAF